MILVDSCVWIDLLRGRETRQVGALSLIQQTKSSELCMSSIVYFEVLRGINEDIQRKRVQRRFDLLERRDYLNAGFDRLVSLSLEAERRGVTLRKVGDWLIVKTLLDHSLTLLTSDKDFSRLAQVIPLKLEG